MKICPKCRTQNMDEAAYCRSCGTRLEDPGRRNGLLLGILIGLAVLILAVVIIFVVIKPGSKKTEEPAVSANTEAGEMVEVSQPGEEAGEEALDADMQKKLADIRAEYKAIADAANAAEYSSVRVNDQVTAFLNAANDVVLILCEENACYKGYALTMYVKHDVPFYAELTGSDVFRLYAENGSLIRAQYVKEAHNPSCEVVSYSGSEYDSMYNEVKDFCTKYVRDVFTPQTAAPTAPPQTQAPAASHSTSTDGLIFPDIDSSYLTDAEVRALSDDDVQWAINDIYALNGYIFTKDRTINHYKYMSWYRGVYSSMGDTEKQFNSYEKENMKKLEQERDRR